MEGATGSEDTHKPWDHAWSTEEMRKNRREWSLAADSGLLKHLQQFSENLIKKANETHDAINSMTSQLNEAAILVDNITNTSLALANTQFIESRVQEDNAEMEPPVQDKEKITSDQELSATDLLFSICESIKQGLSIMDEKYEKVEVIASDSDDDDNPVPSVILRPKDPYQDRPLPYVFDTEQWKSSSKVGLESSSSESEQNDEEDSVSDVDDKNAGNILNSNIHTTLGIRRISSSSSESNSCNIESNSIKDTETSRLHARSQDTLNSYTEPTTPPAILSKTQNISNGPPSFAEELAKRLGNVLPIQKNAVLPDSNQQVLDNSRDDAFTPEDDKDVFSNNSNKLFSEGKNLFSDEVSSSSWKNKPRPVNKAIIPPSIDIPPPLSIISSMPKSTIDDLFGDADDSEDSDDIFSKKSSKSIFTAERECVRSEVVNDKRNPNVENVRNTSTIKTSTPEFNDKINGLFGEDEDDDLFGSTAKQIIPSVTSSTESSKKKPPGGVSIFGKVDVFSSSKFARRASSSSGSESDSDVPPRLAPSIGTTRNGDNAGRPSAGGADSPSVEADDEAGDAPMTWPALSIVGGGVSPRQPSVHNAAGSSSGLIFYEKNNNFGYEPTQQDDIIKTPLVVSYKDINSSSPVPSFTEKHFKIFLSRNSIQERKASQMYRNEFLKYIRYSIQDNIYFVKACCKAEMKKYMQYIVDVSFSVDGEIIDSTCDCPIGRSKQAHCKHVLILLLTVIDLYLKQTVILEETCTDKLQTFHRPAKKYNASPLKAVKFVRRVKENSVPSLCEDYDEDYKVWYRNYFRNTIISRGFNCQMAIKQLVEPANMYALEWDHSFYTKNTKVNDLFKSLHLVDISETDVEKIELETRDQSKSEVWKAERSIRITSTFFFLVATVIQMLKKQTV